VITQSSKEQLKARLDIVDVVASHLELKKAGANFKACCPFHSEATASFVVSPSKQIAHCFGGCGTFDAIAFTQKILGVEFVEAVEKLAAANNFTLEYERGHQNHSNYFEILTKMQSFFRASLEQKHKQYLQKRGINEDSMNSFGIGYAPTSSDQIAFLTRSQISLDDAEAVGILASDKGKRYARFTKRVTFPIYSNSGKLVGFSARILEGDKREAKYLNTPTTKLFDKSSVLFGYKQAKEYIHKKGTMVLLEGQLDVVACHQIGIRTTLANLGTALTDKHISIIKKSRVKVLLAYDGDKAGRAAAYRGAVMLATAGIDGGVVIFDEGDDPADLVCNKREDELIAKLKKPTKFIKFILQTLASKYDLKDPIQQNEALKECLTFLTSLKEQVVAVGFRGYVAHLLCLDINFVQIGPGIKTEPAVVTQTKNVAEVSIIKSILADSSLGDIVVELMDNEAMSMRDEYHKALKAKSDDLLELSLDDVPLYDRKDFTIAVLLHQRSYLQKIQREQAEQAPLEKIREIANKIKKLTKMIKEVE
jgi:DNA primase